MKYWALTGWMALCFAASGTAVFVSTDGWYAELHKPSWNPPSWLFGPVWTALYFLMALAAWLVWRDGGWTAQGWRLGLFLLQWALNLLWTPLFFGWHRPGVAFVEICLLWAAIVMTVWGFWQVRHAAALLLMPYLVWVSFAAVLNYTIWRLNL